MIFSAGDLRVSLRPACLAPNHEGAVIPSGTGTLACAVWVYVAPTFRWASFIFPGFEDRSIRQRQHKLGLTVQGPGAANPLILT